MKAIYGHLGGREAVLADEVRRLRRRVSELEAQVMVLEAEAHASRADRSTAQGSTTPEPACT